MFLFCLCPISKRWISSNFLCHLDNISPCESSWNTVLSVPASSSDVLGRWGWTGSLWVAFHMWWYNTLQGSVSVVNANIYKRSCTISSSTCVGMGKIYSSGLVVCHCPCARSFVSLFQRWDLFRGRVWGNKSSCWSAEWLCSRVRWHCGFSLFGAFLEVVPGC